MQYRFNTNINCGGCVKAVSAFINKVPGVERWEVDTQNPQKVLTVEGSMAVSAILDAVKAAGFSIDPETEQA